MVRHAFRSLQQTGLPSLRRHSLIRKTADSKPLSSMLFVVFVSVFLSAAEAVAEPASKASIFDLSISELMNAKVTVASLFEESELDAASSVSLLTASDWQKTGARTVGDALEAVPSVVSLPTWGGADAIAIRGYATELSVRGIASTLDGVPLNSFTYATSFYDKPINLAHLDRIEMIRGPGSTIYGSDAFHGVISHKLRSSDTDEQSVSGTFGPSNYGNASLFTSSVGEWVTINAGLSMARQGEQDLAYRYTSPYDGNVYDAERDYIYRDVSGFATLKVGEKKSGQLKLSVYASDYESEEFPGIGTQFFTRLPNSFDLDSTSLSMDRDHSGQQSDFWMSKLGFEFDISAHVSMESMLYHWNTNQQWSFDNSRYPASLTTLTNIPLPCRDESNGSPNPIYCPHELLQSADEHRTGIQTYLKVDSQALMTQWVLGVGKDRLKTAGTTFIREEFDGNRLVDASNFFVGEKRYVSYALLQAKTSLLDQQLQLVYGARIDDYSDVGSHTSPRLGLIAKLSDSLTSKLLYGHAFRAPTALERQGSVQGVEPNLGIEPEEIDTVEWVNIFHGENYENELTLFGSQWDDGITLIPTTGTLNKYVNTRKNKSYGIELNSHWQWERFNLQAASSYVRSKNKDDDLEYLAFPKWLFTVTGGYVFPGQDLELVVKQRVMLDYAESDYIGAARPADASNYYRTDFSVIKYFTATNDERRNELFMHVRNLFDRGNQLASGYNAEGGLADYDRGVNVGIRWRL